VDENSLLYSTEAPKCRLYYHTVSANNSNTTNLHSHLKHKDREEYSVVQHASKNGQKKDKVSDPNQPSLTTTCKRQKLL